MLQQLLPLFDTAIPELVIGNANRLAYRYLYEQPLWQHPVCFLQGEEGAGKSLLAYYWQQTFHASYLTLSPEQLLYPIHQGGYYVLDPLPEEAQYHVTLFHLLNQVQSADARLLLCSSTFPATYITDLADLASRLKAAHLCTLDMPDDDMLHALFIAHAASRQLRLEEEIIAYLIKRIPRSCKSVAECIATLDAYSLHHHHPITIPMVREALLEIEKC